LDATSVGQSVAIAKPFIVVGATGPAPDYVRRVDVWHTSNDGANWTFAERVFSPDGVIWSSFGHFEGLAISDTSLAIGGTTSGAPGAVYLFQRMGNGWDYRQKLESGDDATSFGRIVKISGDVLLVASRDATYVYQFVDASWSFLQKLSRRLVGDTSVQALDIHGDTIMVGEGGSTGDRLVTAYSFDADLDVYSVDRDLDYLYAPTYAPTYSPTQSPIDAPTPAPSGQPTAAPPPPPPPTMRPTDEEEDDGDEDEGDEDEDEGD